MCNDYRLEVPVTQLNLLPYEPPTYPDGVPHFRPEPPPFPRVRLRVRNPRSFPWSRGPHGRGI